MIFLFSYICVSCVLFIWPICFWFSLSPSYFICSLSLCSCHWHCHLFSLYLLFTSLLLTHVMWENTKMPLANVCFCGLELTFCSLSNTCKCLGDTDCFNPFPCCIWECGKRLAAVVLYSNSWKFRLPTAELRCTIQCVVSLYNSISGNPSASELLWKNFSTMLWHIL